MLFRSKEESLTDTDKLLEKLQNELAQVQIEKDRLEALTNETEVKMNKYERLISSFEKHKDEMMEKAKAEANKLLEESKQEIDLVVEDLKQQAVLKQHVVIDAKRNLDLLKYTKNEALQNIAFNIIKEQDVYKRQVLGILMRSKFHRD